MKEKPEADLITKQTERTEDGQLQRRDFLMLSCASLVGAAVVGQILTHGTRVWAQDLPMAKEDEPQSKALGYATKAEKVDAKKWPKRAGADGSKQFCYNCQFYLAKGDAKTSKSAPCQILVGKQVVARGWCNSWTQNPNVKA